VRPWLRDDDEAAQAKQEFETQEAVEGAKTNGHAGAAASRDRFRFTAFKDIKLDTDPPYLIEELLPRVGIAVVWGKPKCGKTFTTFDMEMHVALGWQYRGRDVEQGTVLHIACEGAAGLGARKEAWRLYHAAKHPIESIDAADFHLCKETTLDLIRDFHAVAAAIAEQFAGAPIRIITIDTLNRSLKGSESKDEDMANYVRAAVALADKFQCVVLIVHHCGYDTTHPRGHTSLIGAVDADLLVKKDESGTVCLTVENMRDGAGGAELYGRLETVEVGRDVNGDPIFSCVAVEAEKQTGALSLKPGLSAANKRALELLTDAINRTGMVPPASDHIPANTSCVPLSLWREYCDIGGIADSDKPDSRLKAFKRAATALTAAGRFGKWGDFVWVAR
jgi:hypothetical protein